MVAGAQPRWPRKCSIQCCWSMLLPDMDGGRRGKGSMLLTSLLLETAVCCLSQGRLIPSPREQSADGQHRLGQFYLHEKVWLVPALCPSISARMVLATPRERVM